MKTVLMPATATKAMIEAAHRTKPRNGVQRYADVYAAMVKVGRVVMQPPPNGPSRGDGGSP